VSAARDGALFFQARHTGVVLTAVVVVGAACLLVGQHRFPLPGVHADDGAPVAIPVALVAPLLLASLLVLSVEARHVALMEEGSSRRLAVWHLAHRIACMAGTLAVVSLSTLQLRGGLACLSTVRNTMLLTGVGWMMTGVVGATRAAIVACGIGVLLLTIGAGWQGDPLIQPDGDLPTLWCAVVILAVGVLASILPAGSFVNRRRE